MKRKQLLTFLVLLGFVSASAYVLSENGKAGKTGSPGEGTCADCHAPAGSGFVEITSNIPNWTYAGGQTYQINVTVNEAGKSLFGLGVEALKSDNSNAGSLVITNSAETQIKNFTVSGVSRRNVVHVHNGGLVTTPGSKTFSFDWVAPSSDSGTVRFYVAGLAAIGNGDETDDNTYVTTHPVYSASTVGIENPEAQIGFSVYPNPVADYINIKFEKAEKVEVSLISLTGQKVSAIYEGTVSSGEIISSIVSEDTTPGVYFLRVIEGSKVSVKRIIIQ